MLYDKGAFEQLRDDRMAYVEGLRRNKGFEAGILRLLTQLYPDNAHFIYELLQNAEDAKATHARFILQRNGLIFEHDGSRLFTTRDVESITSIGDSTKLNSPTEIGKFGVGFKAVFAYTRSPEIHSGEYCFRIRDLVVPEAIPAVGALSGQFKTRFFFPFDHEAKPTADAVSEVSSTLQALDETTLLFLSNIGHISYALPDGNAGSLSRVVDRNRQNREASGEMVVVRSSGIPDGGTSSTWLRYTKAITIKDGETLKDCTVALAFALRSENSKDGVPHLEIVPLERGRVSIYFPAEKETSNLRFHLHAPFASTVARDSVRDCAGNRQLLGALAELAAECMVDIRERGLLTTNFLEVLPIENDSVPTFYLPIRDRLVEEFQTHPLVPTRYGPHRPAKDLLRGPSDIISLIDDTDLDLLTEGEFDEVAWCANAPQVNQRADRFLDLLEINRWSWRDLCQSIDCDSNSDARVAELGSWLSAKPDDWLQRFYAVLYNATETEFMCLDVTFLALVRVEVDGVCQMVKPGDAFFPDDDQAHLPEDVLLVRKETYSSGRSERQRVNARRFLEGAGVRVFDEVADVERLIDTYVNGTSPSLKKHLFHMKRFLNFFQSNPRRTDVFSGKPILVGEKIDGTTRCAVVRRLYLDAPFESTGLAGTAAVGKKYALWSGYTELPSREVFVSFVRALGIQTNLPIVGVSTENNAESKSLRQDWLKHRVPFRSDTGIDEDWTIRGIEALVEKPTIQDSRVLWSTLIQAESAHARARFRPNSRHQIREADSQLVHCLKSHPWVPDVEGRFHRPKDISRDRLPQGFPYDDRNGLLTAIQFEEAIRRKSEDYQQKDILLRGLGLGGLESVEGFAEVLRESGMEPRAAFESFKEFVKRNAPKPEQPREEVRNAMRRRNGVIEHRDNAPEREAVRRERLIQPNPIKAEAQAYLRAKYTNDQGQMVCQACRNEMPFKLSTGLHYFEAVQAIRGLDQHYFENRLALCPTCAAMYKHARDCSDDQLKMRIREIDAEAGRPSIEMEVRMAGSSRTLRFVGTHFFDLKIVVAGVFTPAE